MSIKARSSGLKNDAFSSDIVPSKKEKPSSDMNLIITQPLSDTNRRDSGIVQDISNDKLQITISTDLESGENSRSNSIDGAQITGRRNSYFDPDLLRIQSLNNTPPVSSRRWVVLMSSFVVVALSAGLTFNMAVLFVEFKNAFGRSNAETSLVQASTSGLFFMSGILIGILIKKYNTRMVGTPSALVAAVGIGSTFFASSLELVIATLGVVTGLGLSGVYLAALSSINEHFDGNSKLMALAFASFGTGFGSIVTTPLLGFLIGQYGWRGCLLVMSALFLNLLPLTAVFKPRYSTLQKSNTTIGTNSKEQSVMQTVKALLKIKLYIILVIALLITIPFINGIMVPFINFYVYKGYTRADAEFFYLIMNISSTFFRFMPGLLKQIPHISSLFLPAVFSATGAITHICFPFASNYFHYVCLMCAFGCSLGGLICSMTMNIVKIVPMRSYSTAIGLLLTCVGVSNLGAAPLLGYITDVTESYDFSFYVSGGALSIGSILFFVVFWIRKIKGLETDIRVDLEFDLEKRISRRKSSIVPWKGKGDFLF